MMKRKVWVVAPLTSALVLLTGVSAMAKPAPAGTVSFESATYSVNESAGQATINIVRSSAGAKASVKFSTTTGGSATAGVDYTAVRNATVTFAADSTSATASVTIVDDNLVDPNESVSLALSSPTSGFKLGTPSTAVLTIVDNDSAVFAAPTGLNTSVVTVSCGSAVDLAWDAVTGATGYNVLRGTAEAGPFTQIGTSAGTSFRDNAAGTGTFWYAVQATKTDATSGNSTAASATVANVVTNCGFETGNFTGWTASSTSSEGVPSVANTVVHSGTWAASLGNPATTITTNEHSDIYQVITLPSGVDSQLTVWVNKAVGSSLNLNVCSPNNSLDDLNGCSGTEMGSPGWSQVTLSLAGFAGQQRRIDFRSTWNNLHPTLAYLDDISVGPIPAPTAAPSVYATAVTALEVAVRWSGVTNATSFRVSRSSDGTNYDVIGTVSAVVQPIFQDIHVTPGATYYYEVAGQNSQGVGPPSTALSVAVPSGTVTTLDSLEGDTSGWSSSGLWHPTTNSTCGPPGYASATHAYYYGQDGACNYLTLQDGVAAENTGTLTSPVYTLGAQTAKVAFAYDLANGWMVDYQYGNDNIAKVEASVDGGAWQLISPANYSLPATQGWVRIALTLPTTATSSLQLRFTFNTAGYVSPESWNLGWMIDDIATLTT
jgi:Calx-beta domain-containing protein